MEMTTEAIAVAEPPPPRREAFDGEDRVAAQFARIDTLLDLADIELTKVEQGIVRYRERWLSEESAP